MKITEYLSQIICLLIFLQQAYSKVTLHLSKETFNDTKNSLAVEFYNSFLMHYLCNVIFFFIRGCYAY